MAMDKTEKEVIAVTQVQEEETIVMTEELQQVQRLQLFSLLSQVKRYFTVHSYKHGPSLPQTVSESQAHTQLTRA